MLFNLKEIITQHNVPQLNVNNNVTVSIASIPSSNVNDNNVVIRVPSQCNSIMDSDCRDSYVKKFISDLQTSKKTVKRKSDVILPKRSKKKKVCTLSNDSNVNSEHIVDVNDDNVNESDIDMSLDVNIVFNVGDWVAIAFDRTQRDSNWYPAVIENIIFDETGKKSLEVNYMLPQIGCKFKSSNSKDVVQSHFYEA